MTTWLGNSRIGSCVGRFGRNKLSNMHGDANIRNLTPQVQALFGSAKGVMFDYTNPSYLYQDAARTSPITASGQAIGSVTDLSPNLKHASSSGLGRPLWQGFSLFDGLDDYMQTAAIDFTATDAMTVVAGIRKSSDTTTACVCELGPTFSSPGWFSIFAPSSGGATNYNFGSGGSSAVSATYADASVAAPNTSVISGQGKISTDTCNLLVNGTQRATTAGNQGTGNYANQVLNIGARNAASLFFNGRIYRLLVIGRALTATERSLAEKWAAQPVGIIIP